MDKIETIVKKVLERIREMEEDNKFDLIPIEASARHIHITKEHLENLFGKGYALTPKRQLSQPGEYLSEERIDIIGPKGTLENVAILGPCREKTQIELSFADAFLIGVNAPLRLSGDLTDSATVFIKNGDRIIEAINSTIVAKRHIHMTSEIANRMFLKDMQIVKVKVNSKRPLIFEDVVIRVDDESTLNMHIDFDEANACGYYDGVMGSIIDVKGNIGPLNIVQDKKNTLNDNAKDYKVEKKVITEEYIKNVVQEGYKRILISKKNIITPLAKDYINKNKISVTIE